MARTKPALPDGKPRLPLSVLDKKLPDDISPAQIAALYDDLGNVAANVADRAGTLHGFMSERFEPLAKKLLGNEMTGTKTILDQSGFDVSVEIPKNVRWVSDDLAEGARKMEADNEARADADKLDPMDYLKVKYEISETVWATMPERIRGYFEKARILSAGRTKFTLKPTKTKGKK